MISILIGDARAHVGPLNSLVINLISLAWQQPKLGAEQIFVNALVIECLAGCNSLCLAKEEDQPKATSNYRCKEQNSRSNIGEDRNGATRHSDQHVTVAATTTTEIKPENAAKRARIFIETNAMRARCVCREQKETAKSHARVKERERE